MSTEYLPALAKPSTIKRLAERCPKCGAKVLAPCLHCIRMAEKDRLLARRRRRRDLDLYGGHTDA